MPACTSQAYAAAELEPSSRSIRTHVRSVRPGCAHTTSSCMFVRLAGPDHPSNLTGSERSVLRLLRRNWLQIGALAAAVAFVGLLATMGGCGSTSSSTSSGGHSGSAKSPAGSPSPTPDAREAQVKAAAEAYVNAVNNALRTADVGPLHALCVPASQADSVVGENRASVLDSHIAVVIDSLRYTKEQVSVFTNTSVARIEFVEAVHGVTFPVPGAPSPALPMPRTAQMSVTLSFQRVGSAWLLENIS